MRNCLAGLVNVEFPKAIQSSPLLLKTVEKQAIARDKNEQSRRKPSLWRHCRIGADSARSPMIYRLLQTSPVVEFLANAVQSSAYTN